MNTNAQNTNTIIGLKTEVSRQVSMKNYSEMKYDYSTDALIDSWKFAIHHSSSKQLFGGKFSPLTPLIWKYLEEAPFQLWVARKSADFGILSTIGDYTNAKGVVSKAHYTANHCYLGSVKKLGNFPVSYQGNFRITKDNFTLSLGNLYNLEKNDKHYCFADCFEPILRTGAPDPAEIDEEDIPVAQLIAKKIAEKKSVEPVNEEELAGMSAEDKDAPAPIPVPVPEVKKKRKYTRKPKVALIIEDDDAEEIPAPVPAPKAKRAKKVVKKLDFLPAEDKGKCGLTADGKKIQFPMTLMGCCGDASAVVITQTLPVPHKIDKIFLEKVAYHISAQKHFDWDWYSFRRNVLLPNKAHIKEAMGLDDFFTERVMDDLLVVLNHWDIDENADEFDEDADYIPINHTTFFTVKDLDY